jgi:integrase
MVNNLRSSRGAASEDGRVIRSASCASRTPAARCSPATRRSKSYSSAPSNGRASRASGVHDLRHVFASHFVMGGGDIFTLQRILGHSTPQLTSDTYAHLSPRHMAGESDRVTYPEPAQPAKVLPFG